jgi:FPC/CPF motif-containing protein YcgG
MVDESRGSPYGLAVLAATLREFQQVAWRGPKRQSLIVFVGPPDPRPDLDRDTTRFWALMSGLAEADDQPWPQGGTRDEKDPKWQWCFAGEPWFVFAGSPAYRNRRSRNFGPCLTLVFQVHRVFEGLSGSSPAGRAAKARVRERLVDYDTIGPHPHLGDPRHSSEFKWRQYMLPDDEQILPERACPFP